MTLVEKIKEFDPCEEGMDWLSNYDDEQKAWDECDRPEWLIWYIGRSGLGNAWSDERKKLVLCIIECASRVSCLWMKEIQEGVDTVKAWAIGEATIASAVSSANKAEETASHYELWNREFVDREYFGNKYKQSYAVYVAIDIFNIAGYGDFNCSHSACSAIFSIATIESGAEENSRLAKIIRKHYPSPPPMRR